MDINFPLVLVLLVFFTGLVWLIDKLFFASRRAEKKAKEPILVEYSKSFFPVLAIVLVLRSFVVEPFQIPSGSMIPTLEIGDFILVNKYTYGIRLPVIRTKIIDVNDPKRGDVMVFFPPEEVPEGIDARNIPNPKQYFIKRVVGIPGDKVWLDNNQLYINDQLMTQALVSTIGNNQRATEDLLGKSHTIQKERYPSVIMKAPIVVPEGHYFMMGDNRDRSSDSRVWGTVPEERIVGKAFAIWMHWDSLGSLPSFSRVGGIE